MFDLKVNNKTWSQDTEKNINQYWGEIVVFLFFSNLQKKTNHANLLLWHASLFA
jgi:hypothetical protein